MVTGRMDVEVPQIFNQVKVESTHQMQRELEKTLIGHDVFISAAAVSDFTVEKTGSKISSQDNLTIKLKPTPKIINKAKEYNPAVFLVGFKADSNVLENDLIESAKKRMREAGADLMVANDVSEKGAGFGSDDNKVILIDDEIRRIPLSTKEEISAQIMDRVAEKII
jgi:phosphopantothenoylcysteine decarboxylase/phosphopantothenate--cysteine ligase